MDSNRKMLSTKVTHESDPSLHPFFKKCVADLSVYTPYIPESLTKKIASEVGFVSSDQNAYKLLSLLADKLMNETIQSIAMIKEKNLAKNMNEEIQPPVQNQSTLLGGSKHIKKTKGGGGKSMTLKNLMDELDERGIPVFRSTYFPHSNVMSRQEEK